MGFYSRSCIMIWPEGEMSTQFVYIFLSFFFVYSVCLNSDIYIDHVSWICSFFLLKKRAFTWLRVMLPCSDLFIYIDHVSWIRSFLYRKNSPLPDYEWWYIAVSYLFSMEQLNFMEDTADELKDRCQNLFKGCKKFM